MRLVLLIAALCLSAPAFSQWKYDRSRDKLTDEESYSAILTSRNRVELAFPYRGGSALAIVMRKVGQSSFGYIQLNRGTIAGRTMLVRFDNEHPVTVYLSVGNDGDRSYAHINEAHDGAWCGTTVDSKEAANDQRADPLKVCPLTTPILAQRLAASKRVRVQVTIYGAGDHVFEFDPQGLNAPWLGP